MDKKKAKQTIRLKVVDLDDLWFAEHPLANCYHRPLVDEELAALGLEDDLSWWSVVARTDDPHLFAHGYYRKVRS